MNKRNLFAELTEGIEGIEALKDARLKKEHLDSMKRS